jgi:hypothetical protein
LAVVAGAPLVVAIAVGGLCWLVRIGAAALLHRRPPVERILPYTLAEPWRQFVQAAMTLGDRFATTVSQREPGPLRDEMLAIGRRIDDGVHRSWDVARKGESLDKAVAALDVAATARQLAALKQEWAQLSSTEPADSPVLAALHRTMAAVQAQLTTAERLHQVATEAADKLRLLNAQLGEAVAQAVELTLSEPADVDLTRLEGQVDTAVVELDALRQGLDEAERVAGTAAPGNGPRLRDT